MKGDMHIGGGAEISGQVGMGEHVRQEQHVTQAAPAPELSGLFDRVAALIDAHAERLPEAARARRDLRDAREEAEAADGDPERRDNALTRLAARVAPVGAVAEAVRQLIDAVRPG